MKIGNGALLFGGLVVVLLIIVAAGAFLFNPKGNSPTNAGNTDNLFSSLFPFGSNAVRVPNEDSSQTTTGDPTASAPKLRRVSGKPIAGAHMNSYGSLWFTERDTGHFFETQMETMGVTRISNTTIPGIRKVSWLSDFEFLLQYIDEEGIVKSYVASLASTTPDQTLSGKFVSGYSDVLPFPTNKEKTVLVTKTQLGTVLETAPIGSTARERIYSSSLQSWVVSTAGDSVFIQTPPSDEFGYLYRVTENGLDKVLGPLPGLSAIVHPNGEYVAYSIVRNGNYELYAERVGGGGRNKFPFGTFAEKCAWYPNQILLFCGIPKGGSAASIDDWLMGRKGSTDAAWVLNADTGSARVASEIVNDAGQELDILDPSVSTDGSFAVFRNKGDLSLWSLRLR